MLRIPWVAIAVTLSGAQGFAEPCNPVIDGTYCATQPDSKLDFSTSPSRFSPIQSLGGDLGMGQEQPATLGAITFNGNGTRCIGLLTSGVCN
jgi:hypothetical protein